MYKALQEALKEGIIMHDFRMAQCNL